MLVHHLGYRYSWDLFNIEISNTKQTFDLVDDVGHLKFHKVYNDYSGIKTGAALKLIQWNTSKQSSWNVSLYVEGNYPSEHTSSGMSTPVIWGGNVYYEITF